VAYKSSVQDIKYNSKVAIIKTSDDNLYCISFDKKRRVDLDISYKMSLYCINEKYLIVYNKYNSEISIYDVDVSSFELLAKYLVR
jgi:hypothetical protein